MRLHLLTTGLPQAETPSVHLFPNINSPRHCHTTITAVGNISTIQLVEDLVESVQKAQPGLRIKVRSIDAAVTPEWWNFTDFPIIAIFPVPLTDAQLSAYERQRRSSPLQLSIGMDALVIVTHKTNPMAQRGLNLSQLDAIFSMTRYRGHASIHLWADLDVNGTWGDHPIAPIGQDASSSNYRYFKQHVLEGGDLKNHVLRLPDSASVVFEVSRDKNAIGYAANSSLTEKVTVVPLRSSINSDFLFPTTQHVQQGNYPLLRALSLYIDADPIKPLDPTVQALLRFILSQQGQDVFLQRGYIPLTPQQIQQERSKIGI